MITKPSFTSRPKKADRHLCFDKSPVRQLRCCLSRKSFTVCKDSVVYTMRAQGDKDLFDPSYLHPDLVARGGSHLRRRVLEKAGKIRSNIRYQMEQVVMMERGAELDIVFDLPES